VFSVTSTFDINRGRCRSAGTGYSGNVGDGLSHLTDRLELGEGRTLALASFSMASRRGRRALSIAPSSSLEGRLASATVGHRLPGLLCRRQLGVLGAVSPNRGLCKPIGASNGDVVFAVGQAAVDFRAVGVGAGAAFSSGHGIDI
jgi:hypothetical protein